MLDKLNKLFEMLEKEFPYTTMAPPFYGAHSITKDRETGELSINVWYNGRLETFVELTEEDLNDTVTLGLYMKQDLIDSFNQTPLDNGTED